MQRKRLDITSLEPDKQEFLETIIRVFKVNPDCRGFTCNIHGVSPEFYTSELDRRDRRDWDSDWKKLWIGNGTREVTIFKPR